MTGRERRQCEKIELQISVIFRKYFKLVSVHQQFQGPIGRTMDNRSQVQIQPSTAVGYTSVPLSTEGWRVNQHH